MTTQRNFVLIVCALVLGTITRFAIPIAAADNDGQAPKLELRAFAVDTNIFRLNLSQLTQLPQETPISAMATYYISAEVTNIAPPRAVFFDDRLGWLYVKAAPAEVDAIEKLVLQLNTADSNPR